MSVWFKKVTVTQAKVVHDGKYGISVHSFATQGDVTELTTKEPDEMYITGPCDFISALELIDVNI